MSKRKWNRWLPNIKKQINETSGTVGFLGLGAGVVGLLVAAPVAAIAGGAIFTGTLGYCAIKGFPERLYKPSELVGQFFQTTILNSLTENVPSIGIIGASSAGKSTFISHLVTTPAPAERTQSIYATIFVLQTVPAKYAALVDGDGTQFNQQFKVIDNSNILFVFFDHNPSETSKDLLPDRVLEHNRFLEQLEGYLKALNNETPKKLDCIHFVLNKRDSWQIGEDEESKSIIEWHENILKEWSRLSYSRKISGSIHSNNESKDIKELLNVITSYV